MIRLNTLVAAVASTVCLTLACPSLAATTKAEYNAEKDRNAATYKGAIEPCKSLSGNPKDICEAEAKATQKKADAMAEADYKATPKARQDAADTAADADYDVAKQKCDAKTGNEKDVCVKEAKAVQTKAKADAKVAQKTSVARKDASDDKRDADYKVAMEKCDGLAGTAKDGCQKNAKASYGK